MNKIVIIFIVSIFNFNLFGISELEYNNIIEKSFKNMKSIKIKDYKTKIDKNKILIKFNKKIDGQEYEDKKGRIRPYTEKINASISINNSKFINFYNKSNVPVIGQRVIPTICKNKDKIIIGIMLLYADYSNHYPWYIKFTPNFYEFSNEKLNKSNLLNDMFTLDGRYGNIINDEEIDSRIIYPYYTKEKILNKLYKENICTKTNITTGIDEEETFLKKIQIKKQYLYNKPNKESKTKMYLIKGDKVEILIEKDDWIYILYKGEKDIKAWIPKSALE